MAGLFNPTLPSPARSPASPGRLGTSSGANRLGVRLGGELRRGRAASAQKVQGPVGGTQGLFGGLAQFGGPAGPMTAPSKAAPIQTARTTTAFQMPGAALLARSALRGLPPPHALMALGMPFLPGLPGTRLTLRQLIQGTGGLFA